MFYLILIIITMLIALFAYMVSQFKELNRKMEVVYYQVQNLANSLGVQNMPYVGMTIPIDDNKKLVVSSIEKEQNKIEIKLFVSDKETAMYGMDTSTFNQMVKSGNFVQYLKLNNKN